MTTGSTVGARGLIRNTVLNAAGQLAPLLVAVPVVPFVLRGLGTERFAILALAWTVIGYFGFLDLGLGRAVTRSAAGLLGAGRRDELGRVVWSSLAMQTVLGLAGAGLIVFAAPFIARDVLRIADPVLLAETTTTIVCVALGLPLVMLSGTFSGLLEAHQRFDLVNLVRVPASMATLALPAVGVAFDWSLPVIVGGIVAARAIALLCFASLAARTAGGLRPVRPHGPAVRQLLGFGGWLTVSLVAVPILTYAERLLIGGLRSLTELAHYAVPFEVIARTAVIPSAMALTLFPAFSHAQGGGGRTVDLFVRPARILFLLQWPLLVVFWLFPREILTLWVGAEAGAAGAEPLRLLALAFFFSAFAHIALAGVHGLGRPDLKAKLDIVQVPLYIGAAVVLISNFGITGAALAKLIFAASDAVVLCVFVYRLGAAPLLRLSWIRRHAPSVGLATVLLLLAGATAWAGPGVRVACAFTCIVVVSHVVWHRALEPADRSAMVAALTRVRGRADVSAG